MAAVKKPAGWKSQAFSPAQSSRTSEFTTNAKPKPQARRSWWTDVDATGFTKRAEREIKS